MKQVILIVLLLTPLFALSQNLKEYSASNGINYKVGDIINLNKGSAPNGDFVYLSFGGWGAALLMSENGSVDAIGKAYAGLAVSLKKIKKTKFKGVEKVMFTVGGGNITNYILDIESAIETCEIKECKSDSDNASSSNLNEESALDKLKKLKELLDIGAITKEEYEIQKEKILKEL